MDVWLLRYGAWIGGAGAIALVVAGVLVVLALRAARLAWAARLFGTRARGARRGLTGAGLGERVLVVGVLRADEPLPLRHPARSVIARADGAGRVAYARSKELVVRRGLARTAIVGDVTIDASLEAQRVVHDGESRRAMRESGRWPGNAPIAIHAIAEGERVAVIGRATPLAGESRGYRVPARALAIGPDEDGAVHVIGLGPVHASTSIPGGIALGVASVIAACAFVPLGLYAPPPVRVIEAQDHLPYHLWLPLASPMRGAAIQRASAWVTPRLWWNVDAHTLDLAEALMEIAPDCDRDAALVSLRPELATRLAPSCDPTCTFWVRAEGRSSPEDRARAESWLRARGSGEAAASLCFAYGDPGGEGVDVGPLGPTSTVGSSVHGWRLVRVTHDVAHLSPGVRRLRVAWLHDLALLEGARGRGDVAHALLDLARETIPAEEEHARIEAALARRIDRAGDLRSAPAAAALLHRIARGPDGGALDARVLRAYAESRSHATLTREAELVASMRCAGAAAAFGDLEAADEFASMFAAIPLEDEARAPRAQVLAYLRSPRTTADDQGTAQVPW